MRRFGWLAPATLAGLFFASIIWSMITETLLPLWRDGQLVELGLNLIGLPIILAGTGLFGWGGLLFVRDTHALISDDDFVGRAELIRDRGVPRRERWAAQGQQFGLMLRRWRRGALWLGLGYGLIVIGGLIINPLAEWLAAAPG